MSAAPSQRRAGGGNRSWLPANGGVEVGAATQPTFASDEPVTSMLARPEEVVASAWTSIGEQVSGRYRLQRGRAARLLGLALTPPCGDLIEALSRGTETAQP
jgi:hypothetical protein